jgi:hypothetical protein
MHDLSSPAGALAVAADSADGAELGSATAIVDELSGAALALAELDGQAEAVAEAATATGTVAVDVALGPVVAAGGWAPFTDDTNSAQRPRQ